MFQRARRKDWVASLPEKKSWFGKPGGVKKRRLSCRRGGGGTNLPPIPEVELTVLQGGYDRAAKLDAEIERRSAAEEPVVVRGKERPWEKTRGKLLSFQGRDGNRQRVFVKGAWKKKCSFSSSFRAG